MLFVDASNTKTKLVQRFRVLRQSLSCHRKKHSRWEFSCTTKHILNTSVNDIGRVDVKICWIWSRWPYTMKVLTESVDHLLLVEKKKQSLMSSMIYYDWLKQLKPFIIRSIKRKLISLKEIISWELLKKFQIWRLLWNFVLLISRIWESKTNNYEFASWEKVCMVEIYGY